ncbi:MAG: protein tyrosine phosphatase, partial [Actinobacteria bacterium]|nr:protein tyrosine phosphatase [Actinomycetota bacterium]
MIDLHSHVLPGIDDGAATFAESLAIARAAVEDGVAELAATPHVRADYPTSAATMLELVARLRARIASEGVPLLIHTGGEISLDSLDRLTRDELRSFGLGGSRYLLLEFPYAGWPLDAHERLFRLQLDGFVPVIAHPERSVEVKAAPERVAPFVELGALVQVTAASLDGRFGPATQRTAHALVRGGLA